MKRSQTDRRGTALVEFAFVLPIICLLFGATLEISRVLLLQHTADTAAYEGARVGMLPGSTSTDAISASEELLEQSDLRNCIVIVEPEEITEETETVTVAVSVPVAENSWILPTWVSEEFMMSSVTLYCERPTFARLTGVPEAKPPTGKLEQLLGAVLGGFDD